MNADVVSGMGVVIPKPLRTLMLNPRNNKALERLAELAESEDYHSLLP